MQRGNVLNLFHSITLQLVQEFLIQTTPVCFLQENQTVLTEDRLGYTSSVTPGRVQHELPIQIPALEAQTSLSFMSLFVTHC